MAASSTVQDAPVPSKPSDNYLTHEQGFLSWAFTLDHKRIGIMYLVSVLVAFLLGGVFALVISAEHWDPGANMLGDEAYNQAFTLHGVVMVFLVVVPAIPAALGNLVLPLQLGAKRLAFPRVNLLSYHLWVLGAVLLLASLSMSAVDTGWTFFPPYSINSSTAVIPAALGVFVLGVSSMLTGLNFVVTISKLRPAGMHWFRLPLFQWGLLAAALIQLVATPVLCSTLLILIVERLWHLGIFDPAQGGDPLLFRHFFWFYAHPALFVMIVPAFGVIGEIIPVFSRKKAFGYRVVAMSLVCLATFAFFAWGQNMLTTGQSAVAGAIFSALGFLVGVPAAIIVFNWLATMYEGRLHLETPMLYALAFICIVTVGGLSGICLPAMSVGSRLEGSYFMVGHLHYLMMGGTMTAFLAGLHYWWPKITGRMYDEKLGRIGALLVLVSVNLAFFPQFVLGVRGMPARYHTYPDAFQGLQQLSTVGAFVLGFAFVLIGLSLWSSLKKGRKAAANPWGGTTLEWSTSSPPPYYNFRTAPTVTGGPYDGYGNLTYDEKIKGYVLAKSA